MKPTYYYYPDHNVFSAIYDDDSVDDNIRLFREPGFIERIDRGMSASDVVKIVASRSVEVVPKHTNWQFKTRRT